jgi:hypothetical protein
MHYEGESSTYYKYGMAAQYINDSVNYGVVFVVLRPRSHILYELVASIISEHYSACNNHDAANEYIRINTALMISSQKVITQYHSPYVYSFAVIKLLGLAISSC